MAKNERNKAEIEIERMNKRKSDSLTVQIENIMRNRINGISGGRSSRHHCIYKVNEKLREVNQNAYTPELVSIGPLHNDDRPSLKGMHTHKLRYMKELFSDKENSKLNECVQSMRDIEKEVRGCYSEIPPSSQNAGTQFVEMMLEDGSFIIQLFLKLEKVIKGQDKFEEADSFLLTNLGTISRDMVLLENQLPMLVLDELYDILIIKSTSSSSSSNSSLSSVTEHALQFFKSCNLIVPEEYINFGRQEDANHLKDSKHLLDLFGKTLFPVSIPCVTDNVASLGASRKITSIPVSIPGVTDNVASLGALRKITSIPVSIPGVTDNVASLGASRKITSIPVSIPCVTELRLAGVRFRKVVTPQVSSFLDIEFRNATLFIPPLTITDQTETVFRNLIAYENCSHGRDAYKITSYAFIMDRLIDTPDDIHYLCKQGIITNALGDDEAASNLFNKLCSEVTIGEFYYSNICHEVNRHYNSSCNVWKADFKRTYCRNPWTFISAVAAIVLLLLTATQTTTSIIPLVLSKHDNSSSSNG